MAVTRILRISLTTAMPGMLERFYIDVFGFELISRSHMSGPGYRNLMGVNDTSAQVTLMRLGEQILELIAFDRPGAPYPYDVFANDLRFQHFAIVVSDMTAAYAKLLNHNGWSPITRSGPQQLPPRSGSVTAFKFRDPEGHPLELIAFDRNPPPILTSTSSNALFLGIDHSAITVADTFRSKNFYERVLGFTAVRQSLNVGDEQERLDNLEDVALEVAGLAPETPDRPHLELLCYKKPKPPCTLVPKLVINDIATTRLVLQVRSLKKISDLLATSGIDVVSNESPTRMSSIVVRDPDNHALVLT